MGGIFSGPSLPSPASLKGLPPPPNGYMLAQGVNSLSTANMPDWRSSYKKDSAEMLTVLMNGAPLMQVSAPTWQQGFWDGWKFEDVQGHVCQVQDAAGQLVCVIAPEAGGGRFPNWDVREVIHTVRPNFPGQRESISHNGIPLYMLARVQKKPVTEWFRGGTITHLHMATGEGFEFQADPSYEWNGPAGCGSGGSISYHGEQTNTAPAVATADKGQFNFGPGVDPCLMVLFAVANDKHRIDCDQNTPG